MKKGISQEQLKLIACVTMLADHIGAVLVPGYGLRILGRLAFPIYCFLLTEGFHHSHDRRRYGFRLLFGAVLAELPFDLVFSGGLSWQNQSVMLTLLLGFFMLWGMEKGHVLLPVAAAMLSAEVLRVDYGCFGIVMIALFSLTREDRRRIPLLFLGLGVCFLLMNSIPVPILGIPIPIQLFGLVALIPIGFYSGRKKTRSKAVQWAFYLFYPVHLTILYLIAA